MARDMKSTPKSMGDSLQANLEAQRLKAKRLAAKKEEPRTYVVVAGDTLSAIAKKFYGDANRWKDILEANKDSVKDANAISVGQELVIPE